MNLTNDVHKHVRLRLSILAAVTIVAVISATSTASAADQLPDLGMAPLQDVRIDASGGTTKLRFTAIIVNIGQGAFELNGSRTSTTAPWTVNQKIYDAAGGSRPIATRASLVYGGDGHNHWHVLDLEEGFVTKTGESAKLRFLAKRGYCFYDTLQYRALAGSPSSPFYTSTSACSGGQPGALSTLMGLSVGWGDRYWAEIPDQYIDVTGVANGKYRLHARVNAGNGFLQSSPTNDETWLDFRVKENRVTIISYGPGA